MPKSTDQGIHRMGSNAGKYCVLEYLYRDAGNYKAYGKLLLDGCYSPNAAGRLTHALQDGEFFIPEQVGIPPLQGELYAYSNGPIEDDHIWHEFVELRPATAEEAIQLKSNQTLDELLAQFAAVTSWDSSRV